MQLRRYSKSKKTDDLVIASTETGIKRISQEQSNWQWITPDLEPEIAFSLVSLSPSTICQCQDQDFENARALFNNEINNEVEGIGPKMRSKMRQRDWSSQRNQDQDIYPIFIYIFIYIFNFNFLYIFHIIYSHLSLTKRRVCYGVTVQGKRVPNWDKRGASFFYQKDSFFPEALDILGPQ